MTASKKLPIKCRKCLCAYCNVTCWKKTFYSEEKEPCKALYHCAMGITIKCSSYNQSNKPAKKYLTTKFEIWENNKLIDIWEIANPLTKRGKFITLIQDKINTSLHKNGKIIIQGEIKYDEDR